MERKQLTKPLVISKHREANPPSKEERLARFKGRSGLGRGKGTPNKVTRVLKDAIMMAAENVGSNGKGKGGLTGYLETIANKHPKEFTHLLSRVLPLEEQRKLLEIQWQLNKSPEGQLSGSINYRELKSMDTDELKAGLAVMHRVMSSSSRPVLARIDKPHAQAHAPQTIEAQAVEVDAS